MLTVILTPCFIFALSEYSQDLFASVTIPKMSSSVSVGRPIIKYSLTALYPPAKAVLQATEYLLGHIFIYYVLSLWEPASGAKVSPLSYPLHPVQKLMEKLSALREAVG